MIIDRSEKTITMKITYFGPALSGKTTSIRVVFSEFGQKEALQGINSPYNKSLFLNYGTIKFHNQEWILKVLIYTFTGQDFLLITRPFSFKAVDGIIFVLDSHKDAYEQNMISWKALVSYFGDSLKDLPISITFNKRDLSEKFKPEKFLSEVNIDEFQTVKIRYTTAVNGEGVLECFKNMKNMVLKKFWKKNNN